MAAFKTPYGQFKVFAELRKTKSENLWNMEENG